MARVVQYFLIFLLDFLEQKRKKMSGMEAERMKKKIAKLTILYSSFSMFRGWYRFGSYVPTIVKIGNRIHDNQKKPVQMMYT